MSAEKAARGRAIEAQRSRSQLALVKVAAATALLGAVSGAALAWTSVAPDDRQLAIGYVQREAVQHIRAAILPGAQVRQDDGDGFGGVGSDRAATILLVRRMGIAGGVLAILFAGCLTALQRRHWIKVAEQAATDQALKGARLATPQQLVAILAASARKQVGGRNSIMVGEIPLPISAECRHLLAAGATGSGKTSFLSTLVRQIEARGECAVIYDPDGGYVSRFYRPERGDVIVNAWDQRTVRWTLIDDIRSLADAHRVAAVLLPRPSNAGESGFWYDQARLLIAHVLHHLARTGGTLHDLAALLNGDPDDKENTRLRAIVAGTPAARIFALEGGRATASVLLVAGLAARTIHTLASVPASAEQFSFDKFIAELDERDGPRPFLFFAAPRRYRDLGTPVVTACIDAVASAMLQRTPGQGSQVWTIIDELPTLPPVQSLNALLPEGRKYRVSVTIAFQSLAQLNASYGTDAATVITGQTGTQIILGLGDTPTAKWASELVGVTEAETMRLTLNTDTQAKGERGSLSPQRERHALVMDSELTGLSTGEAFLRLAGRPVTRLRLPAPRDDDDVVIAPAFIEAPDTAARIELAQAIKVLDPDDDDEWLPPVGAD